MYLEILGRHRTMLVFLLFIAEQFDGTEAWINYQVEYDKPISLICEDSNLNLTENPQEFAKLYWILPSGESITGLMQQQRFTTSGTGPDGWNLTVTSADDPDFGIYICVLLRSNLTIYSIKLGVNKDGPYYGDLLAQYQHQAMIGGIAAGSVLVLTSLMCLIYHCRYKGNGDEDAPVTGGFKHDNGIKYEYDNPHAVEMEEIIFNREPSYKRNPAYQEAVEEMTEVNIHRKEGASHTD